MNVTIVRPALQAIYDRDGKLTPEQVVAEAADPDHTLHPYFTWDDTVAAHKYRLLQAAHLIRSCKIRVKVAPERTERVRVFTHVPTRQSYVPTVEALRRPEDRNVVLEQALRDLDALRRKYQALLDWSEVLAEHDRRRKTKAA